MPIDPEKLAKLQKSARIGIGKGTPRRKTKKITHSESSDQKLQGTLKKLGAQVIPEVGEANFFRDDGKVLHFPRVQVQSATNANTFAFTGTAQEKDLGQLFPNILPQLGNESLDALRKLAAQLQQTELGEAEAAKQEAGDEDIPDLVEGKTFEDKVE